jgi:hypothetical protein
VTGAARAVALALVTLGALSFGTAGLWADDATAPSTTSVLGPVAAKPYDDAEFEPWVLKLRRAEIIAVGAFPVAYIFAGLGYDWAYYAGNGFPQDNIPWPAGPGTSQWTTSANGAQLQQKNWSLVGMSVGISLAIAALDWVLGW